MVDVESDKCSNYNSINNNNDNDLELYSEILVLQNIDTVNRIDRTFKEIINFPNHLIFITL